MAKKFVSTASTPISAAPTPRAAAPTTAPAPVSSTPVRNSPVPPRSGAISAPNGPRKQTPTREQIALRAYQLWQQSGGSQDDNWYRAERELRGT